MEKNLGREDWLRAARLALLKGGVEAVRVEKLARALKVTKGSFYWHFKDREELLELLLREWETELDELVAQLGPEGGTEGLRALLHLVAERVRLSEQGRVPSDAAIFTWASVSPEVARRVNRAEQARIDLLARWSGRPERIDLFYLAWLGFVARGQRVPGIRRKFPEIAEALMQLLENDSADTGPRQRKTTGEGS
jgi:AcrR family transcriptional regulator